MGWFPWPPVPPSEAKDGEAYKLRFLGTEEPGRPVQKGYGNLYVLGIIASVALILIGSALYLGLQSQSEVRITISNLTTSVGPCDNPTDPAHGTQTVNYSFMLTNSGTRDAYAILYFYSSGVVLDWTSPMFVSASATVPVEWSTTAYSCGAANPTVAIHSVSPVP